MGVLDRFSLQEKVVLVTVGARPPLGRSHSSALVEARAPVITASRSLDANLRYADELCMTRTEWNST